MTSRLKSETNDLTSRKQPQSELDLESTQPLLEKKDDDDNKKKNKKKRQKKKMTKSSTSHTTTNSSSSSYGKTIVAMILFIILLSLVYDVTIRPPDQRLFLQPDLANTFLLWVQANPYWGQGAICWVIAICVVLLIPIGTPLTLGCGYIYKGVYGWTLGVAVATLVSMAGSALGAVLCFLLGRYLMRDRVRQWVRQYPLFDAIDMAVSEHGLRIMAMLYLTPVLPLGPVSYMCGSTSMALSSFVLAKIASLPLMVLYVYLGATAGTLLLHDHSTLEHNTTIMMGGIVLSACMIGGITYTIRNMLMTILEKQQSKISHTSDVAEIPTSSSESIATNNATTTSSSSSGIANTNTTTMKQTTTTTTDLELGSVVVSPSKPLQRRHVMGLNQYSAPPKSSGGDDDDDEVNSPSKDK